MADGVTLTPTVGVEWNRLEQEAYTETGAGALSLVVPGTTATRLRSVLGARLEVERRPSGDRVLRPSVRVAWRHDFRDEGIDTTAAFIGGGAAFVTPGQSIERDTFSLGAGLDYETPGGLTLSVNIDGELADGYRGVGGALVARWRF
jgi:outer membrane autotransporter protein